MPNVRAVIQRYCHDLEKQVVKSVSHPKHCVVRDELGVLLPTENGDATERLKHPLYSLQVQRNFARVQVLLTSPLVVLVPAACLAPNKKCEVTRFIA